MHKDKRYSILKNLIVSGHIKSFEELFDIIPKTVVSKDLNIHYEGLIKRISNPGHFTFAEIFAFARLIEVDEFLLIQLIAKEISPKGKNKKSL